MKINGFLRSTIAFLIVLAGLVLFSCRGVGIFAYIATTDKEDSGLLPDGLGSSKVVTIAGEYGTTNYDYFSSGTSLRRRDSFDRSESDLSRWESVALPTGWTSASIQSIAASNQFLLLALARESGSSVELGLFFYDDDPVASNWQQVDDSAESLLVGSSGSYKTVQVYCPNPASASDNFYVNVLTFNGDFSQSATFAGSELFLLGDAELALSSADAAGGSWAAALASSYISSGAYDGGTVLFTTVDPISETGNVVGSGGATVGTPPTIPSTALTWLPDARTGGAWIMSSKVINTDTYEIYLSDNDFTTYTTIDSSYRYASFLDVTQTEAGGQTNSDALVLAGTRSIGSDYYGAGYMEIVTDPSDLSLWTLRTDRNSFTFAQTGSYIAGTMVNESIVGFSVYADTATGGTEQYVYASTDGAGIWRIHADDETTFAGAGLEWAGE